MSAKCPYTFANRLDYHEGNVSPAMAQEIANHISSGCNECARSLVWMRSVLPAMHESAMMGQLSVSQRALKRAFAIMPPKVVRENPIKRAVSVARLLMDNRSNGMAFAGARDLSGAPLRAMYQTDELDIDMMQEPASGGKWHLFGEAMSQDGEDVFSPDSVVLISSDSHQIGAEVDDAEFSFPPIQSGTYSLKIAWDDHDVVVEDLVVGA